MTESEPTLLPAPRLDRRTVVVFATAVVLLVVFEYWGLPSSFAGTSLHTGLADALGEGYRPYFDLLPYEYWGVSSLVLRVLVPLARGDAGAAGVARAIGAGACPPPGGTSGPTWCSSP